MSIYIIKSLYLIKSLSLFLSPSPPLSLSVNMHIKIYPQKNKRRDLCLVQ